MDFFEDKIDTSIECPDMLPFASLPGLIKNGANHFSSDQEKLLFVYSVLVTMSGTMTKIKGTYGQKTTFPNLFFLGLAPAASGKSTMLYPKAFLQPISRYFSIDYKNRSQAHSIAVKAKKDGDNNISVGDTPSNKCVIIPANCSSSKLMQHLAENSPDTPTIMFESEIDTIAMSKASDFGNYSDILRKVYENEPVSLSRKMNNEFYDVQKPKMSLLLSGTPAQVFKLIDNNEDGLFSRFLMLSFNTNNGWRSMGPCPTCINLTDYFEIQSLEYFKMWEYISKDFLEVNLPFKQWQVLDAYCSEKYLEIALIVGDNATAIIKRHGSMLFKLCMVLTGFRKYEEQNELKVMLCREEDFKTALYLVDQSLYSSLEIYNLLPNAKFPTANRKKDTFYLSLPTEFNRAEGVSKAQQLRISMRSADRYLNYYVSANLLDQPCNGKYKKAI